MDELLETVIEAGVEIAAAGAEGSSKKGCLWMSLILIAIGIGVTLYFVL